jgi:hypothetical protein
VVNMHEIVERKYAGDTVSLGFLRDGDRYDAEVTLKGLPASRMYAIRYEKQPRYIVFAGLVFQPLDTNLYASTKLKDIHVRRMYADYVSEGLFEEYKDIVVLTRIEDDPLTSHLDGFDGRVVDKINGTKVTSLDHANELLHPEQTPDYFVIDLLGAPRPIVFPADGIDAANRRIQSAYGIDKLVNLEE